MSNSQKLGKSRGQSDQGGTGVENDTSVVQLSNLVAKGNGIEVNLPVGLAAERNLGQLASVVALVDTTEGSLGVVTLLVGVAQVEAEDRLVKQTLVQQIVEGRGDLVDGDGVIAQTQDAIETTKGKGQTGLAGGLREELVLDLQVTDRNDILRYEATQASRSVTDAELGAVLLVSRRGRRVVLGVEVASNGAALGRGDPEVGATGIKDDLEGLRRGTDLNLGEVYRCLLELSPPSIAG